MDVFRFGFRYWKRNLFWDILNKVLSVIALGAELLMPLITAMFIDYCIGQGDPSGEKSVFRFLLSGKYGQVHTLKLFLHLAAVFILLLALRIGLVYLRNVMNQVIGLNLETDLRMATFRKLMELDSETLSRLNAGELVTTLNSDTIMFKELFCRIIPNLFDAVFVLVAVSVILAGIDARLLVVPLLVAPFFSAALLGFRVKARRNFREIRAGNADMSLTVQENIEAVRLVRSFTNEDLERGKFDRSNQRLKEAYIRQVKLSSGFEALFNTIKQGAYIASIAVCAVLVLRGVLQVGILAAVTTYILRIMDFISQLNNMVFQMQQQLVSGRKMMEFMALESRVPDGGHTVKHPERADITVLDASLVLDGKQILKGINLEIPYGRRVGIVGGTGSGKSMLLESLIRVHDLTGGNILLNGRDVRDYELDALRREFAFVFQDVFLFSNTIDANIAYYEPEIEKSQVTRAAKHAQAHSFIMALEAGYETVVGERGLGISGGQKQRVSIARALLKDSPVLVLDDSTSALDVATERHLLADIKEHYPDRTLLIAAHRLRSVRDCDEILYMQDGMIIERGTFEELMALNGHFAAVYRIQELQEEMD
ncbi:MAG: ABC transporter ATP-binding protein/permease [Lachnospiraceae bacterium]|nr:ABC transporter ATP-binding protein/permease [Lachnospiraceae bacterium]